MRIYNVKYHFVIYNNIFKKKKMKLNYYNNYNNLKNISTLKIYLYNRGIY
jgi:hypothetical protein